MNVESGSREGKLHGILGIYYVSLLSYLDN